MKNGLLQQATRFYQNWRRKQLWYRMVSGMACVVVFCTVYALILPAITLEKEPGCGLEEHTHTEACYTVETVWPSTEYLCGEDPAGHVHDDEACYDEDGNLICGYADFVVHTHDESCYDRNGDLACPLEEIEEHRHDADCYSSTEVLTCGEEETGHVHDKSCYTRVRGDMTCGLEEEEGHTHGSGCYETERDLVCTLEEGEDHTHDESCYETRQVLTCELEESEGHAHSDDCYDWTEELTCGREEAEGHIHDGSCYTTVRELVCDEEEVTLHTHDESCYDTEDCPLCAEEDPTEHEHPLICGKVQVLAHQHDETCAVEPEGEPEEMQVLTCGLEEHTHTDACRDQNAEEEPAYLCGMEEHTHIEDCYNKDGELTCDLPEHVHSETCVTPLEPEEALPDNAFPEELPEGYTEYTFDSEDGLSVLVYAPENAFGGQAVTLKADKLAEDSQGYMDAQANLDAAEDVEYDGFVALDIRFEDEAGTEVEPDAAQGPVYVKLDALALLPESANRASVAVQHHCTEAADPIVAVSAETEPEMDPETEPETEPETVVRTVADCNADTGTVEVTPTAQTLEEDGEQEEAALDVTAAFAVEEFSTFTVTWAEGAYQREIEPDYYDQPIHSGIELRLFDYGSYINSSGRPLGFWASYNGFTQIDGNGSTLNGSPTMSRGLGADGYPEVVYNGEKYSLKYLFRNDGDPLVLGEAENDPNALRDYNNMRTNATAKNGYKTYYESMRLEVDGDGGLFHVDEDGYYTYASSEQSAYFDQAERRFLVNDTLIKPGHFTSTENLIENGNFLPFDKIDPNADDDRFTRVDGTDKAVYRTGYDGTKDLKDSVADLWFGMTMGIDFYVPADGKVNGKDMVFEFKGDDDVWVYIDDVLVLDIGGVHGAQSGTINFATGAVNSPGLKNTNLKTVFKAAGRNTEEGFKGNTFVDWSEHTLKFYYMERGGNISYCSLKFNLQIRPEKSLQVTKNLTADSDADADVVEHLKNTAEYKFRVVKADSEGKPTDQLLIKGDDTYTISGSGLPSDTTRTVGLGGYFTLKAGQVATFSDMLARFGNDDVKQYVVQEVLPDGLVEQYGDIAYTVGSAEGSCTNDTITDEENFTGFSSPPQAADKGTIVTFNNKVDTQKLSRLKITKEQVGSSFDDSQTYYMRVLLGPDEDHLSPVSSGTTYGITHANGGKETKTVAAQGILVLNAGDTAELKLLAGTCYQVKEVASGTGTPLTGEEGYTPTYKNDTGTIAEVDSTVQVTVTNTFPNGALKLTKTVRNTAGGDTSGEFEFELKCPVKEGWEGASCPVTYTSSGSGQTHTGGTLSFTPQDGYAVATVKLYHDETVTVSELPTGAQVTATELNADGYSVGWNADGSETYAKAVTVTIPDGSVASVTCTNTTGMEFPETGGAGTGLYTMGGLLLIAGAGILLLRERAKRRREDGITA